MVTAEFAVGLLAVLPVMFSLIALTGVAAAQVAVVETARTCARLLARGESATTARSAAADLLPGAEVLISRAQGDVVVDVRHLVTTPGLLPDITLRAQAVTPDEASDAP